MLKAIKIRLYLNEEQEEYVAQLMGTCRFVYNQLLAFKIKEYNENRKTISFSDTGKKLTELKSEYDWIKKSHSKVLQQSLINLEYAYKSFFKNGNGFPKFKSKHDTKQSCRFPVDAISGINGNKINLIKQLKNIHFKSSVNDERYLNKYQNNIKSATLTNTKDNKYYLSILIDSSLNKSLPVTNKVIGIDLGIKDFIITSDNTRYENIKIKRNNESKLAKLHKVLSRKQKGSSNRNKQRIKLAKFYNKLTNIKENYLHHIVNKLLSENQTIVIEDLQIKNMMKNHNLAKSLQELSFYRFKEILTYKANWYSRDIIQIDKFFPSSKLCSSCGNKNTELKLSDREWKCTSCNTVHDRDYNAALNILNEGKRLLNIGLSSPEYTLEDYPLMDDKECNVPLKSNDRLIQEKNVISLNFME
jgi:putative transposase